MLPEPGPRDNIGPFYKLLAAFLSVIMAALLVLHEMSKRTNTWIDFGILTVLVCFILALVRPDWLDGFFKTVADKLPFLKFEK